MLEINLIFACGFGANPSLTKEIFERIKKLDRKPMNWVDIEVEMAQKNNIYPFDIKETLVFQDWKDPELPKMEFSGQVEIVIPQQFVWKEIIRLVSEPNTDMTFSKLRQEVWESRLLGNNHWLNFEIRWEINRLIGRLTSLGRNMQLYL